jgi:hypothetical protein
VHRGAIVVLPIVLCVLAIIQVQLWNGSQTPRRAADLVYSQTQRIEEMNMAAKLPEWTEGALTGEEEVQFIQFGTRTVAIVDGTGQGIDTMVDMEALYHYAQFLGANVARIAAATGVEVSVREQQGVIFLAPVDIRMRGRVTPGFTQQFEDGVWVTYVNVDPLNPDRERAMATEMANNMLLVNTDVLTIDRQMMLDPLGESITFTLGILKEMRGQQMPGFSCASVPAHRIPAGEVTCIRSMEGFYDLLPAAPLLRP